MSPTTPRPEPPEIPGEKPDSTLKAAVVMVVMFISAAALLFGLYTANFILITATIFAAGLALATVRIAAQWQKAIILRLGRYYRTTGPGLFFLMPFVDSIAAWIDQRVMISSFVAEQTLTKDTVPVDVDAVMFWVVWDPEKAALEVADYKSAVSWAAQTALREVIGRTLLAEMLAAREHVDEELVKIIDKRTEPWGIAVQAVEIRDVVIPTNLQKAMSKEAQAERERRARIILGQAEKEVAKEFAEASKYYDDNQTALQLRAMNILYEGMKERGAMVVVPNSAVETMGMGTITGLAAMSKTNMSRASEMKNNSEEGE